MTQKSPVTILGCILFLALFLIYIYIYIYQYEILQYMLPCSLFLVNDFFICLSVNFRII